MSCKKTKKQKDKKIFFSLFFEICENISIGKNIQLFWLILVAIKLCDISIKSIYIYIYKIIN